MNRGMQVKTKHGLAGIIMDISKTPSGRNTMVQVWWKNNNLNWWPLRDLTIIRGS